MPDEPKKSLLDTLTSSWDTMKTNYWNPLDDNTKQRVLQGAVGGGAGLIGGGVLGGWKGALGGALMGAGAGGAISPGFTRDMIMRFNPQEDNYDASADVTPHTKDPYTGRPTNDYKNSLPAYQNNSPHMAA